MCILTGPVPDDERFRRLQNLVAQPGALLAQQGALLEQERAKNAQCQASGTHPCPGPHEKNVGGADSIPTLFGQALSGDVCHVGSLQGLDMSMMRLHPTLVKIDSKSGAAW